MSRLAGLFLDEKNKNQAVQSLKKTEPGKPVYTIMFVDDEDNP